MKRYLFLLFVALPLFCFAQKKGRDKLEPGNREEASDLYQYATELELHDSLVNAMYAYVRVFYFDSATDMAKKAEAKLTVLSEKCKEQLQQKLTGSWQWKWSGSNWGMSDNPGQCNCERSLVIEVDKLYFLTGNTIDSSHQYSLQADNYGRWPLFYYINVPALSQKWNFGFRSLHWPVESKEALSIRKDNYGVRCICGCPEDIYERFVCDDPLFSHR